MFDLHRNIVQSQLEHQRREERLRNSHLDAIEKAKAEGLELFRNRRLRKDDK